MTSKNLKVIIPIVVLLIVGVTYFTRQYLKTKEVCRTYELYYKFGNLIYKSESKFPYVFNDGKIEHKLDSNKISHNTYELTDESLTIKDSDEFIDLEKEVIKDYVYVNEKQHLKNLKFSIVKHKDGKLNYLYNKETDTYLFPTRLEEDENNLNPNEEYTSNISPSIRDSQVLIPESYVTMNEIFDYNTKPDELIGKKIRIKAGFKIPSPIAPGFGYFGDYNSDRIILVELKNFNMEWREYFINCIDYDFVTTGCDAEFSGRIAKAQSGKLKLVVLL
jgi:hypothetical protein